MELAQLIEDAAQWFLIIYLLLTRVSQSSLSKYARSHHEQHMRGK